MQLPSSKDDSSMSLHITMNTNIAQHSSITVAKNPMDLSNFLNTSDDNIHLTRDRASSVREENLELEPSSENRRRNHSNAYRVRKNRRSQIALPLRPTNPQQEYGRRSIGSTEPFLCSSQELVFSSVASASNDTKVIDGPKKHSNRAYTKEQVHWIRYMKEDCGFSFKVLPKKFALQFPDFSGFPLTDQCFSSRYYRDNRVPETDKNWEPAIDKHGKVRYISAKVRARNTPEGRVLDIPYFLVDKHPEYAITYNWVSPEHKEVARAILRGGMLRRGKKDKWRRLISRLDKEDVL